jgi:outer membrane immunogenic protein
MFVRRLVLALGVLIVGSIGATAADLPMKAPPIAPPVLYNWTGFYVGLNAGGTFGGGDTSVTGVPILNAGVLGAGPLQAAIDQAATGGGGTNRGRFIGGGQIGWNWQFGNVVAGIEADFQGLGGSSGAQSLVGNALLVGLPNSVTVTSTVSNTVNWLGTLRGRLGILATPSWLLYATGGLAYGGVRSSVATTELINGPNAVIPNPAFSGSSFSKTRVGWTVGAGAEWMFAQKWSAKVEYLYYDLGTVTDSGAVLLTNTLAVSPFTIDQIQTRTHYNGHIARVGINYHF